jgi:hypothetical protein
MWKTHKSFDVTTSNIWIAVYLRTILHDIAFLLDSNSSVAFLRPIYVGPSTDIPISSICYRRPLVASVAGFIATHFTSKFSAFT